MTRSFAFAAIALLSTFALASPKDDITAAARKLAASDNYTWVSAAESGGFPLMGGPTTGYTEKDGHTTISLSRNSGICIVLKGSKAVLRTPNGWLTPEEVEKLSDAQRSYVSLLSQTVKSFELPPVQAQSLLSKSTNIRKIKQNIYAADLTEEAANSFISRGVASRRDVPKVLNPKGSVSFHINDDGLLVQYAYTLSATLEGDQVERSYHRVITTRIQDINSTTVAVPPEAKQKLE